MSGISRRHRWLGAAFGAAVIAAASPAAGSVAGHDRASATRCANVPSEVPWADYGTHEDGTEYWYWWSHLSTPNGHQYAVELLFGSAGLPGRPLGRTVDAAVTDVARDKHVYVTVNTAGRFPTVARGERLELAAQSAAGSYGHDVVRVSVGEYAAAVTFEQTKPAVRTFDGREDEDRFANYERQHNEVRGTLTVGHHTFPVSGIGVATHAWMPAPAFAAKTWEWLLLHLDDGTDVMVWQFRRYPGGPVVRAAADYVDRNCDIVHLSPSDYQATPSEFWQQSPDCRYPLEWTVRLPGASAVYHLRPTVRDQELRSTAPSAAVLPYWEGLSRVSGSQGGWADEELAGYCRGPH